MGKSKRRSEWDRFRATTAVTDKMRTKEFSLKPKKSSGATTNKGQKAAKEDWKLKEREIRNSAAPPSLQ
jgi:hypothetical protein